MSIYDINFTQTGTELSPSFRRDKEFIGFNAMLSEPLNDLNLIFKWYREGSTASDFNALTVYTYGSVLRYSKNVYLKNEYTTDYVAGILPSNSLYFTKILDLFLGATERIAYSNQKIIFEYALNRYFETTFRQLPLVSDIYITRDYSNLLDFWVSEDDLNCQFIGEDDTDTVFVSEDESAWINNDYNINIPIAVFNALADTNDNRERFVRSFANKINRVGFKYTIITY